MHKGFLYLIFYLVNFIIIFPCDFLIVTCITMVFLNVCVCALSVISDSLQPRGL